MFDPMDNEKAKRYIDNRIDGGYVIPMYVVCNGKRYGLDELDEITSFLPSALNVGFGGCTSPIERYPFPMNASYSLNMMRSRISRRSILYSKQHHSTKKDLCTNRSIITLKC